MVAGAASLWGSFSIFFRPAEKLVAENGGHLSAATESFCFFLVVFVALSPRAFSERTHARPTRAAWMWMAAFSIADALNLLLYFGAMQRTTVAVAVLTHYLQPVIVALLSPWVMREKPQKGMGWTAVLAVLGLSLLLEPHQLWARSHGNGAAGTTAHLLGAAMGAMSAVLFAGVMFSIKRLGQWFSSLQILCLHYPGALLLLYLFIPEGELIMSWQPLLILLLAGLIPGTIGGYLFVEGVRHLSPSRAGILTLLEPVFAVAVGTVLWGERPGVLAFGGASIILFSAYRVLKQRS